MLLARFLLGDFSLFRAGFGHKQYEFDEFGTPSSDFGVCRFYDWCIFHTTCQGGVAKLR